MEPNEFNFANDFIEFNCYEDLYGNKGLDWCRFAVDVNLFIGYFSIEF